MPLSIRNSIPLFLPGNAPSYHLKLLHKVHTTHTSRFCPNPNRMADRPIPLHSVLVPIVSHLPSAKLLYSVAEVPVPVLLFPTSTRPTVSPDHVRTPYLPISVQPTAQRNGTVYRTNCTAPPLALIPISVLYLSPAHSQSPHVVPHMPAAPIDPGSKLSVPRFLTIAAKRREWRSNRIRSAKVNSSGITCQNVLPLPKVSVPIQIPAYPYRYNAHRPHRPSSTSSCR